MHRKNGGPSQKTLRINEPPHSKGWPMGQWGKRGGNAICRLTNVELGIPRKCNAVCYIAKLEHPQYAQL